MPTAKITTLTPVHIGSGTTYSRNIDFVQEGGRIGIVDANKVAALIGSNKEAIDQWVSAIDKGTPLMDFLRNGRGLRNAKIDDISERICTLKDTQHQSNNLKEQYRTSIEGVCIPGSSLKGAIKTAVWNDMANTDFVESLTLKDLVVLDREGKPKTTKKGDYIWGDDKLDKQLFGDNANEKSTRFLKIGDAHFPKLKNTEVHNVLIINKYFRNWDFKKDDKGAFQQMLFETIPAGQFADFEFKIDKFLLERNIEKYPHKWPDKKIYTFYHQSDEMIVDFCNLIYDFTNGILSNEIKLLKKEGIAGNGTGKELLNQYEMVLDELNECEDNEFVIRIGGNSGWDFTTGGWVKELSPNKVSDEDFKKLRIAIQKKDRLNTSVWPKTRKTTPSGTLFGFVKVQMKNAQ